MKRGFIFFEFLLVLAFITAILTATTIILHAKAEALNKPLGSPALELTKTYLGAENKEFLERELQARYAIENSVYMLAAGAGTPNHLDNECITPGSAATTNVKYLTADIPELPTLSNNFAILLAQHQFASVAYDFALDHPLKVTGVPLLPEPIEIGKTGSYNARRSFSVTYNYPFKETYDLIRGGIPAFDKCRQYPAGDAKTLCVGDVVKELNVATEDVLVWSAKADSTPDNYLLDIEHQYKMPLCTNAPLTRIRISLPTVQSST